MTDEVKKTTEETTGSPEQKAPEVPTEKKEQTVSEVLNIQPKKDEPKQPDTVGLDKFMDEKRGRKDAEKRVKELEETLRKSASNTNPNDIEGLAKQYEADPNFVRQLADHVRSEAEKNLSERIQEIVKPLEDKTNKKDLDERFSTHFAKTMETMPEYKNIVNPEVIKALSLDPKNAHKSFEGLIEEVYGNALTGKRTIDSTVARGGNEPDPLDMDRARRDSKYFDEVMSNPKLKAQYNAEMLERGI